MNAITDLIQLLASTDTSLLMRRNEYIAEIAAIVPFFVSKKEMNIPLYKEEMKKELQKIKTNESIHVTDNLQSEDLPENSIAYHRVMGTITADSYWRFSSKQMQHDLLQAEANPNISSHFIHISSGGGEAWYLEKLAETIRTLTKPSFAFIEKVAASAGYYIASQTSHISCATNFDLVGCIGTMVGFMDIQPMLEKWGMKFIEEVAQQSDLKNKKYNDLRKGKPKQYIEEELNPVAQQFIDDVKLGRPSIAKLPEDHPVLRGETFYANKSIENGLIDTIETIDSAIYRAYDAGVLWKQKQDTRRKAIQSL